MKAAWLVPVVLGALACGGGEGIPRAENGGAGAGVGGMPTTTGGAPSTSGGTPSVAGSVSNVSGSAGAPVGGSGGAPPTMGGAAAGGAGGQGPTARPAQRTVVYLPDWRGSLASWSGKIDYSRITYLNVSFADVDTAGNVTYKDTTLDAFVQTAHAAGVKVCLAIGGASVIDNGGAFATVLQDGMRDTVVSNLAKYAADHDLDCIDVDLEGNGVNQYYEAFVTSLATKLHAQNDEMTAAVSSWFGDKITTKAIQAFDFINVMAYDLHNPGGTTEPVQSSSIEESTQEVEYWIGRGLAKEKAVFGVPFYGYTWKGGKGEALTYAQILAAAPSAATQDQVQVAGSTTFLNSRTTIEAKAKLAKQYGGIMVWELGQDAAGDASLLKAIIDASK